MFSLSPSLTLMHSSIVMCPESKKYADSTWKTPTSSGLARLELNTWMLLQALMAAQKTAGPPSIFCPNPFIPMSMLVQAILCTLPLLTELVIVWSRHPTANSRSKQWFLELYKAYVSAEQEKGNHWLVDALDADSTTKSGGQLASNDGTWSTYIHINY
jgi:hypothetical protein